MQNQNHTNQNNQPLPPKPASAAGLGSAGGKKPVADPTAGAMQDVLVRKIVEKIKSSENILVALSKNPTVDEMAGAIGLTLFLDGLQKHATAIYSGKTPDALRFLQPEGTFESNTDSLRDFIIALNKEKADHLRYRIEGDYVKVYITPYKTVIQESDLEFSQGDFNVNLVLALGVPTPEDLDDALSEYGRIMHDATTVDIAVDVAGRFAEIEWSDPEASSVCEMVLRVIESYQGKDERIDKAIATALLTGIVAATDRFSNDRTNSDTMQIAAKLMSMGADQQLIAAHVMDGKSKVEIAEEEPAEDPNAGGNLLVGKDYEPKNDTQAAPEQTAEAEPANDNVNPPVPDLLATPTRESEAAAMAAAKLAVQDAVAMAANNAAAAGATGVGMVEVGRNLPEEMQNPAVTMAPVGAMPGPAVVDPQNNLPPAPKDYAQMLEQALAEPVPQQTEPVVQMAPEAAANGEMGISGAMPVEGQPMPPLDGQMPSVGAGQPVVENPVVETPAMDPAAVIPDPAAAEPVLNPDGIVLPPPPVPDMGNNVMPPEMPAMDMNAELAAAAAQIQEGVIEQPQMDQAMPEAVVAQEEIVTQPQLAPVAEPGAFQIPGM